MWENCICYFGGSIRHLAPMSNPLYPELHVSLCLCIIVSVYHQDYQGAGESLWPIEWPETSFKAPTIVCKTFGKRAAMASNLAGGAMFGPLGRARGPKVKEGYFVVYKVVPRWGGAIPRCLRSDHSGVRSTYLPQKDLHTLLRGRR